MTTISPGYHGEDVAVADAPGINEQPDGQFTYRVGDIIISASSEEELQEILNFLDLIKGLAKVAWTMLYRLKTLKE